MVLYRSTMYTCIAHNIVGNVVVVIAFQSI